MNEEKIDFVNDRIFFLNHEIRRPLTNLTSICELLKSVDNKKEDYHKIYLLLTASLEDFDKAISKLEEDLQKRLDIGI